MLSQNGESGLSFTNGIMMVTLTRGVIVIILHNGSIGYYLLMSVTGVIPIVRIIMGISTNGAIKISLQNEYFVYL